MNLGFNSEISVGSRVCHIQTEIRDANPPVMDTVVYIGGQVVHRQTQKLDAPPGGRQNEGELRHRVEAQHRSVLLALRDGVIALEPAVRPSIQVQLLNPATWFAAGTASLSIEVRERMGKLPVQGAQVSVVVKGGEVPVGFATRSDLHGRAEIVFPMPRLKDASAQLVIRAEAGPQSDEIRYTLRQREKPETR